MATSSMVDLFAKCGLEEQIASLRNFKRVMASVKGQKYSVWDCKTIAISGTEQHCHSRSKGLIGSYGDSTTPSTVAAGSANTPIPFPAARTPLPSAPLCGWS